MIGKRAVRAAAKLWYVKMLADQQSVPVPRDSTDILSGAADPDRVLLLGNGPTHGWGTVTHELALTGQLGRALTRRTTRTTDIRYIGDELMNLAAVIPWIGEQSLAEFDLVLLVLSLNDALRLTPEHEYRADMERLLTKLALETKPSARIVIAGIQPVASLPHYRGVLARIGQASADRLNATTQQILGRFDGVEYMALDAPDPEPGRPYGSPQMYADWAESFADVCAPALDEARRLDVERVRIVPLQREWDWEPGRRIIEGAPLEGWRALDDLVAEAKDEFGVDVAYVSLIDGDRQFYAANTGPTGRSVPLDLTHCRITIQGEETLVVENSFKDERFKHSPLIDMTQMRFYAGTPLRNEEGEKIGTFCVLGALPGASRSVPEERLEAYAAAAQAELQRLAADRGEPATEPAPEGRTRA
ncbi:GAF domain-containing protein [Amnibacterium endophyticum]|uniref:GAF domain-containing protein n=1 Tax=Amnibacterium endophyticum TaxID=2109337 RepID=A0ABW4LKH4_9MICO